MHTSTIKHWIVIGFGLAVAGCGNDSFSSADAGGDGQAKDSSAGDVNVPDVFDEAGNRCPGATINHPGSGETRQLANAVQFTGSGRDANCIPLFGPKLVWTDSLGGQIGTGESFMYTFPKAGTRTITLTATDLSNNATTASITLTIN